MTPEDIAKLAGKKHVTNLIWNVALLGAGIYVLTTQKEYWWLGLLMILTSLV